MVFQLPPRRAKCITCRNIRVFVGMPFTMFMLCNDLGSRRRYLDADLIDMALTAMFVRKLDDHLAMHYLGTKFFEALRQHPYAPFKSGRRLDTSPGELNWERHRFDQMRLRPRPDGAKSGT